MPNYTNDIYDVEEAFRAIEDELMASMMRNMKHHTDWESDEGFRWSQWQAEQLKALEKYKLGNRKKFSGKFSDINSQIDAIITSARSHGGMDQEIAILKAIKEGHLSKKAGSSLNTSGEFFKLNDRKMNALITATKDDFSNAEFAMLRQADDQYRKIIFNAEMYANSGAGTYAKAIDMATKDFLARGITCIEYKNGARHTMADYASMCLRTASKRAYLTGEGEKRQEWGEHLVILNKRGNACPLCLPFVGKVLIDDVWSGGSASDGDYPLMSTAMKAGLYHPRCKDIHTTYFPELEDIDAEYTKKEVEQVQEDYQQEQQGKNAERQADKYSRLAKYAVDPGNQRMYEARADEWNNKQKELVKYSNDDIINSGAISGARNPNGKAAEDHAKRYYDLVRSMKTDVTKISKTTGYSEDEIQEIKNFIFMDKHDLGGSEPEYFAPDYVMGETWRRLIDGKPEPHDLTLIKHEITENSLMHEGYTQAEAHIITSKKYNYNEEAKEFYGKIKKYRKE